MANICEAWRFSIEEQNVKINAKAIKYLEDKINLLNLEIEVLTTQLNKLKDKTK